MTQPIRTAEEAIAWQWARLGLSRLDAQADWDAGPNVDDCALFQSQAVFGQWVAWNVDVLTGYGAFTRGKAGIRRGDLVLFDWDDDGVGDHVEMALESPRQDGTFQTIGANRDSSFKVRTGARSMWVKGYVRPAYKTTPATPAKPPTLPRRRTKMDLSLAHIPQGANGGKEALFLLFGPSFYCEFTGQAAANAFAAQIGAPSAPVTRSFFDKVKLQAEAAQATPK